MCNVNAPCYKCPVKCDNCHFTCRDYLQWKEADHIEKLRREEYDHEQLYGEVTARRANYYMEKSNIYQGSRCF